MKRTWMSFWLCVSALLPIGTQAQIYLNEDFEQVPVDVLSGKIPDTWTLYNDNNIPNSQFGYCQDAWNVCLIDNNKAAISPSWFVNSMFAADRWLVSPQIIFPEEARPMLDFSAKSFDKGEKETYYILISTQTTEKEDFKDTVLYVSGENGDWNDRFLSLEKYAGDTVHIAFVQRSLNRYALYLDNIRVSDLNRPSVRLSSLLLPDKVAPKEDFSLSFNLRAILDENVSEYEIGYILSQNGSEGEKQTWTEKIQDPSTEEGLRDIRLPVTKNDFNLPEEGTYNLQLWVENLNGKPVVSDTLKGLIEITSMEYFNRNTLMEVFSSSTCSGCPMVNLAIKKASDSIYRSDLSSQLSIVKYQMDFPGPNDPCVTSESLYRGSFYGVTSIPHVNINGEKINTEWSDFTSRLPGFINEEFVKKTPVGLSAKMNRKGQEFEVSVEVSRAIPLKNNVLYVIFTEDSLHHEPQSNGETEFFHVARKLMPDAYGQNLPDDKTGKEEYTFTYTFDMVQPKIFSSLDGVSAVIFVQDTETGEILQSLHLPAIKESTSSEDNNTIISSIDINLYPNPCKDHTTLSLNMPTTGNVDIDICNIHGSKMWTESTFLTAGLHSIDLPVSNLTQGIYLLRIRISHLIITKKIVIC